MKTAMQQLIEEIDNQQKRYIDLAKKDKKLSKGVDAILTATTLLKIKGQELIEVEKNQLMETYAHGMFECISFQITKSSDPVTPEQYYQKTFKSDK